MSKNKSSDLLQFSTFFLIKLVKQHAGNGVEQNILSFCIEADFSEFSKTMNMFEVPQPLSIDLSNYTIVSWNLEAPLQSCLNGWLTDHHGFHSLLFRQKCNKQWGGIHYKDKFAFHWSHSLFHWLNTRPNNHYVKCMFQKHYLQSLKCRELPRVCYCKAI